jgi:hypothetical protein
MATADWEVRIFRRPEIWTSSFFISPYSDSIVDKREFIVCLVVIDRLEVVVPDPTEPD